MSLQVTQKRVYWFCVTKCKKRLKSPETGPGVLSGWMQRATSGKPAGSLERHRARKDQPAFILTAQAPGKESQTWGNTLTTQQQKQRQAHREPEINSATVPENFLEQKWSKPHIWWLNTNLPDPHGLRKGLLGRHSDDYLKNYKAFDVLERSDRTFVG